MPDDEDRIGDADRRFARLRDDKTAAAAKQLDKKRVKADADKTARLKAARLERDAAAKKEAEPRED